MKLILKIAFAIAIPSLIVSCKKEGASDADPNSLIGKWSLLSDSAYKGFGAANHPSNYTGRPGDYFDFRENGKVYTREGGVSTILDYQRSSDSTVVIGSFGIIDDASPAIAHILRLSTRAIIIYTPISFTPGGVFGRKVSLKR